MQSPHFLEFQSLVEYLSEQLVGAQLQDVMTNENGLVLSLYRFELAPKLVWMVFDLDMQRPFVGLYDTNPWARLKSVKPMGLFLNANFKNNIISQISVVEKLGRVMEITFNTNYKIEFRLIPKQPNFLAYVDKKKMSWYKPKDLAVIQESPLVNQMISHPHEVESRSVPYMMKQWISQRELANASHKKQTQTSLSAYEQWVAQRKRDIEKKQKALKALGEQIHNPQIKMYNQLGEHLKVYGLKRIPEELIDLVKSDQSVSWNIQNCFTKAKLAQTKIAGAQKRAEFLKEELQSLGDLSEIRFQNYIKKQAQIKEFQAARKKNDGDFRKLTLDADVGIHCWMGKSAADNLKLLRQSKAWDLWVHLKDYPSAYAIIQKNKDQKISDEMLRQSAAWLIKEGVKNKNITGVKTAVVVVECRHVRPIKGDKIGRVTYHHAREMLITV